METEKLEKYIGMAVDFTYYHYSKLHNDEIFPDGYCDQLKQSASREYWEEMYRCLGYALTQEDYCLHLVISPVKDRYKEADIRLFLEKFYIYLEECLKSY